MRKESPAGTTHYLYSPEGQLLAELDAVGNTQREYLYLQSWPVAVVSYSPAVAPLAADELPEAALDTLEEYPETAESAPVDATPAPVTSTPSTGSTDRASDATAPASAVAITPSVQLHYLHPDHLGTPRLATDSAQRVVWRWDSAPFGDTTPLEDPDGDGVRVTLNLRFPGQYFDTESGLHYNYYRDYDPTTGRYVESDPIGLRGGVGTYGYVDQSPIANSDVFGLLTGYNGCSRGQTGKIKQAEGKVRKAIGKICSDGCTSDNAGCVPCKYRQALLNLLSDLPVACKMGEKCGVLHDFTEFGGSRIMVIYPRGFDDPKYCGCLESTILHELMHAVIPKSTHHRYINDMELKCFSCAVMLGPDHHDSYGDIHDLPP